MNDARYPHALYLDLRYHYRTDNPKYHYNSWYWKDSLWAGWKKHRGNKSEIKVIKIPLTHNKPKKKKEF